MSYTVAVRALCEFTAKRGDLDLRFTPSPSAQEGIAGHTLVASRRGPGYQAELSLAGRYRGLAVRGRADGYDPATNRLEEVKTFRGDLAAMPDNHRQLHWAQLRVYGWLLCQTLGLAQVHLALVYFDIASQQETVLAELADAGSLQAFFEVQCAQFLHWAALETAHRAGRNADLRALAFPHAAFRCGQHDLAGAVYRAASSERCLLAQAPTGIGKTIACLFAQLKAMPGKTMPAQTQEQRQDQANHLDKIFFLAAKTPGRRLALGAVSLLQASRPGLRLRTLELVARDKACEHPDKTCHGDSCPLAKGFYDRLPQARTLALTAPGAPAVLDFPALRAIALDQRVCPYYLAQDLVRWSDVVVGDYHYYFDTSALLHALAIASPWRVALLVDEAHNLPDRARAMYSAELDPAALAAVRRNAPLALDKPLARLHRAWRNLQKNPLHDAAASYQAWPALPDRLLLALQQTAAAIADHFDTGPALVEPQLQRFYFDLLQFTRLASSFGTYSLFDLTRALSAHGSASAATGSARLCIRNVVPAPFLAPRFAAARSAVLFSATLGPQDYLMDLLGLPADCAWVDLQSPFRAEQLAVRVVTDISTRYADRGRSLVPIADLVARQYAQAPGNYLVFVSSYDYLRLLADAFGARHPAVPVWEQTRRMDELAREAFLARFQPGGQGIGFAVLGGAFAEGIDLPGSRLIGAFIATLGLPQVNPVTEQVRRRLAEHVGPSRAYAYAGLVPGLQKVVQAAGRVIRTPADRGVVYLMDDRFAQPVVARLLPGWWTLEAVQAKQSPTPASAWTSTT